MNDPNSPLRDAVGQIEQEGPPVSVGRRRFAKGAAPVVLGTLISKPVLGAPLYHCTVSGQVSGNLSRPGLASECAIGDSRSDWLLAESWSPILKGTFPTDQCAFNGQLIRGTNFNGFQPAGLPALANAFFNLSVNPTGNIPRYCDVVSSATQNPATMFQVLNTDPEVATSELFQLGRVTVVALLNSYKFAPDYAVTTHTIIAMFNATYAGGKYIVNSSVEWDRAKVIAYLTSLNKA